MGAGLYLAAPPSLSSPTLSFIMSSRRLAVSLIKRAGKSHLGEELLLSLNGLQFEASFLCFCRTIQIYVSVQVYEQVIRNRKFRASEIAQ